MTGQHDFDSASGGLAADPADSDHDDLSLTAPEPKIPLKGGLGDRDRKNR